MPLDLYAGALSERIEHRDEVLLQLAAEDASRYPRLNALWATFHDDPRLSAAQSGDVLHELIALLASNGGAQPAYVLQRGLKLLAFFSAAHRAGLAVRCVSD